MNIRSTSAAQPCKQVAPEDLAWGPQALRLRNSLNRQQQAAIAERRPDWLRRNTYYYQVLLRVLKHVIEPGKRLLNLRCQTGFFLDGLSASYGVGVDISPEMIDVARREHPRFAYYEAQPEEFSASEKFDYILLCDVGEIVDLQKTLLQLQSACHRHTRVVIYNYNHLWEPLLKLAERLGLKVPQPEQNWLSEQNFISFLSL